jgi:hypothetical protein
MSKPPTKFMEHFAAMLIAERTARQPDRRLQGIARRAIGSGNLDCLARDGDQGRGDSAPRQPEGVRLARRLTTFFVLLYK